MFSEPIRQRLGELVLCVAAGGNGEDVVELFKGALLGLRQEEKDEQEGDNVEAGVEAEGALRLESLQDARE